MRASARVEVARRGGCDVLADVRSEPPLAIRSTGHRVLLVGSAAGPVGGDELSLEIAVGPGARLSLGSVAATIAWPGPSGAPSAHRVHATVADGGHLAWAPEPLLTVAGCRHRTSTTISLAANATAWVLEEVVLGRRGEVSGSLQMAWRVERDGSPLLHHAEHFGPEAPGWGSAVTTGGHRHVLAALAVGSPCPPCPPVVSDAVAAAVLEVATDAWVLLATGADRLAVQRACGPMLAAVPGPPDRRSRADPSGTGT